VCSAGTQSRESFSKKYGFRKACAFDEFVSDNRIDTVFILGPNRVHYEHLRAATAMKSVRRIYLEKPVCSNADEEIGIREIMKQNPSIKYQVGFQYLFSSAVREALAQWRTGIFGKPLHFELKYYHPDYLDKTYRDKRKTRLTAAPDGGAMADLGSHAISFLIAFLGKDLEITGAMQSGKFGDVPEGSDLFSLINIVDRRTEAAGVISASRISAGTGDDLSLEIYAENGSIRLSSSRPEYYEFFARETGRWSRVTTGSTYKPYTSFPSGHVPPGWLRAMVHAHYIFLTENSEEPCIPGLEHGLEVQRLVRETAEHLAAFRKDRSRH
jgi:predicted dehydrogenase